MFENAQFIKNQAKSRFINNIRTSIINESLRGGFFLKIDITNIPQDVIEEIQTELKVNKYIFNILSSEDGKPFRRELIINW